MRLERNKRFRGVPFGTHAGSDNRFARHSVHGGLKSIVKNGGSKKLHGVHEPSGHGGPLLASRVPTIRSLRPQAARPFLLLLAVA